MRKPVDKQSFSAGVEAAASALEKEADEYELQFPPESSGFRTAAILRHAATIARSADESGDEQ